MTVLKSIAKAALRAAGFHRGAPAPALTDLSEEDLTLIRWIVPAFSMTTPERVYAVISAVRYLVRNRIQGDLVECGVWRGGSMMAAAKALLECGDTARTIHLFDTFEGMPPPEDLDRRFDGASAEQLLKDHPKTPDSPIWAVASLEDVRANVAQTGYPEHLWAFVKGRVEDTIPAAAPNRIALLRLDTDWYASTKHELEHLYDRVVPGGVVIIDDYGWYAGSRKATDEFFAARAHAPLLHRIDRTGRMLVKP